MNLYAFLSGAVAMGFFACGLFFLRFWWRTRDNLFSAFAAAFWLFGINQALLVLTDMPVEERSWLYLIRLAGFSLIIFSIVLKNRQTN